MDPILALVVIEQTIATIVIAAAIVIHSRATTRILEAHVEPEVHVTVVGGPESNLLAITNDAGCAISNLNVIISTGCVWGSQPYAARHCLYLGAWQTIAAGATEKPAEQPITPQAFASAQLPDGAKVDTNDIIVEYSFTRRADKRRYAFKYQLGVFKQADDRLVYVRLEEPKMQSQQKCVSEEEEKVGRPLTSSTETVSLAVAGVSASTGALGGIAPTIGAAAPCIG